MKQVFFKYDTKPTEEGEVVVGFKVDEKYCEMKIPEKQSKTCYFGLQRISYVKIINEMRKNSGLDVCGSCHHNRIWGK